MDELGTVIAAILIGLLAVFVVWHSITLILFPSRVLERMDKTLNELKAIRIALIPAPSEHPARINPPPIPQTPQLNPVTCKCNNCSADVSFNGSEFQPGAVATCPQCGVDTQLYVPPALAH